MRAGQIVVAVWTALWLVTPPVGAQTCSMSGIVGAVIPADDVPTGSGVGLDLSVGTVAGLGLDCGGGFMRGGVEVDYQRPAGGLHVLSVLGSLNVRRALSNREGAPWFAFVGNLGIALADRYGDHVGILSLGRRVDLPSTGLAIGAGMRGGVPLRRGWWLVFSSSIRATVLPTVGDGLGRETVVTVPVSVGIQVPVF